eukprot:g7039.t1
MISWDGTFAEAKQTLDGANVLVILLNEHSHVLSYCNVLSEKWSYVLPMFMECNPTEFVMMKLFPGLKKWPIADAFHKFQIGTDSMVAGHEYYADAARELGSIVAEPCERDFFRCANRLVESGVSSVDAVAKTLGPWGKRNIRTSTPPDIDLRLGQWLTKWSKVDAELLAQNKKPLLRMLKRLLISQSSRVGPDRADRELAYLFKWHNDSIDVRRGIPKQDFMWGRTWSEAKAGALWANIDGPSPGGNQHMPAEVCQEEGLPEAPLWNDGKEFFGHEYFPKLNESNLKESEPNPGFSDTEDIDDNIADALPDLQPPPLSTSALPTAFSDFVPSAPRLPSPAAVSSTGASKGTAAPAVVSGDGLAALPSLARSSGSGRETSSGRGGRSSDADVAAALAAAAATTVAAAAADCSPGAPAGLRGLLPLVVLLALVLPVLLVLVLPMLLVLLALLGTGMGREVGWATEKL